MPYEHPLIWNHDVKPYINIRFVNWHYNYTIDPLYPEYTYEIAEAKNCSEDDFSFNEKNEKSLKYY